MKDGFIKVAACTPKVRVADVKFNVENIIDQIDEAYSRRVKVAVFPELCITAYTCQDLFFQDILLDGAMCGLVQIAEHTQGMDMLIAVGCPVKQAGKIYNCAAIIKNREILQFVPKTHIPNYNEFYEARYFTAFNEKRENFEPVDLSRYYAEVGSDLEDIACVAVGQGIFSFQNIPELIVGFEICEDLWVANPVSNKLAERGATLICNLSASDEVVGKESYRRQLVANQSARLVCGYIYASAGEGESTQDMVFAGHNLIAENGAVLAESKLFKNGITISEIDVKRLAFERRKLSTYPANSIDYHSDYVGNEHFKIEETTLTRTFAKTPFIPLDKAKRDERCHLILQMQAQGLKKRLEHTRADSLVIGISGGLDSSLALLVCVEVCDLLGRPHSDVVAVTMPCFGTTKRTRSNAEILCEGLGVTFREVDISKSVLQHFEDIGHDFNDHSVVFENGQARERTKVLMDIANQCNGLVIGTGDLSELALGWATYNGDHMSMYGVNASIPKTLVRHLVEHYAQTCTSKQISEVLFDVLDTPVSPELLPTDDTSKDSSQKTEDLVGPYELHDFFLYYGIRWGYEPAKVRRLALYAFGEDYDEQTIDKWLKTFYRRFFSQQFKRSCLPDGAKVGSVTLSPRGDWRMSSDSVAILWQENLE